MRNAKSLLWRHLSDECEYLLEIACDSESVSMRNVTVALNIFPVVFALFSLHSSITCVHVHLASYVCQTYRKSYFHKDKCYIVGYAAMGLDICTVHLISKETVSNTIATQLEFYANISAAGGSRLTPTTLSI